ncbi:DUF2730 domain-containing protein [Arhodomonas aquaeolei]|uniref:DUF2730 domain-containing protein n=1 Tax=Arhodomonas aquaeolei TaxID=2369 RepID=UPI00216967D8|nr:DUF2730 domain-containing protein [Arhodomonas aquaeolei]MCS4503880.1 DUF2730 domain-containing protein [Arhodomonas aquaeolei]
MTDWGMDWNAARFALDALVLIGVVVVGVHTWWVSRRHATADAIRQVDDRVDDVEQRLTQAETDLRNMPSQTDVSELSQRIGGLHGDLREIKGSLQGLSRAVDLMNEHLIRQGSKES